MKRSNQIKIIVFTAMLWLSEAMLYCQPSGPPGGGGDTGPIGSDAGIPLDGGLISLLLAGLGILAVRKFKRKKE